jgi:hypothetical protein
VVRLIVSFAVCCSPPARKRPDSAIKSGRGAGHVRAKRVPGEAGSTWNLGKPMRCTTGVSRHESQALRAHPVPGLRRVNWLKYETVSGLLMTDRIISEGDPSWTALSRYRAWASSAASRPWQARPWPNPRSRTSEARDARRTLSPISRRLLRIRRGSARRPWRCAAMAWCCAALARGGRLRTQQEPGTSVQMHALPGRRHD